MQRDAAGSALTDTRPTRREDALFALGRDADLGPVRRWLARSVSGYARAPLRVLLGSEAAGPLDGLLVAAAAWGIVRLAGSRARWWRDRPVASAPSSGWRGNLVFLAVWAAVIAGLAALLPR